jgi:benzoylsuccinyl-CoA thiolase BbsB subunit
MPRGRDVFLAGVGLHRFGRFPDISTRQMSQTAILDALGDADVPFKDVQAAYYGHVYPEGTTPGQSILRDLGMTGIPILNVENACASGSSAVWQAFNMIAQGVYDVVLAFGAEKVPKGPVSVTPQDSADRHLGTDHMMAEYALRMTRYMHDYGAPMEAIAQVSVKAHENSVHNPNAQFQKVFSLEEVLGSRMIADPLNLFQCCPTSEGAAAAVLVSGDVLDRYGSSGRAVRIRGASLRTTPYQAVHDATGTTDREPEGTALAARDVYEASGLGPEDVDIAQVHDAATIGELEHLEFAGLFAPGEAWVATQEGRTGLRGSLPVNTDGGLQAMGHPFGASGIRMLHELTTQIRGAAGTRQVDRARVGLAQCTGSGGVNTVIVLSED